MPQTSDHPTNVFYRDVLKEDMILRDVLAADRTVLANERTLLAYIRTALGLIAVGASVLHFFEAGWLQVAGWMTVLLAPLMLGVGFWRFLRIRRTLNPLR